MALLTKEQIIESDDRPTLELHVPEWGGHVFIRTLSGTEVDGFEKSMMDKDNKPRKLVNLRARFAVLALCDEDGKPLFSENQAPQLGNKSGQALTRGW